MKQRKLWIIGMAVFLVAGVLSALFLFPRLRPLTYDFAHTWPGKDMHQDTGLRLTKNNMEAGAERLLSDGTTWEIWHMPAGRGGQPPAEDSGEISTDDQVLFLQYLVEENSRSAFNALHQWILNERIRADGHLISADGENADNRTTMALIRALAEAYTAWGDRTVALSIQRLNDRLWQDISQELLPSDARIASVSPTPTPGTLQTPTPGPQNSPVPEDPAGSFSYIRLDGMDLYTLQLLQSVDGRWGAVADKAVEMIQQGFVGAHLPLFAVGLDPESGTMLPFDGDAPTVDTQAALLVHLHLCEAGLEREETTAWIRSRLYNDRMLYAGYHIVSGEGSDRIADPAVYGIVGRIARVLNDENLYELALDRLRFHTADLRSSAAFGTVFRTTEENRVQIAARDNLWALLAMR